MRGTRLLALLLTVTPLAAGPAAAGAGEVPIDALAFIWGVGPRVDEAAAGFIPGFAYSAPFEDLRLKK